MKSTGWSRFSWDPKDLPETSRYIITETYSLRTASRQEKSLIHQVINSCFAQEACWNVVASKLMPRLQQEVEDKFAHHREGDCLVITHGNRVIAASIVDTSAGSDNHLITGPCITVEYRNRGFGALLLKESLLLAAQGGPKFYSALRVRIVRLQDLCIRSSVGWPFHTSSTLANPASVTGPSVEA